ncbi:MAG: hypothetical protein H9535_20215 [Ignavibacteria bacterium]|nr:hypothetical protein [Ignavibacteria bacterium]
MFSFIRRIPIGTILFILILIGGNISMNIPEAYSQNGVLTLPFVETFESPDNLNQWQRLEVSGWTSKWRTVSVQKGTLMPIKS